jgi:predicted RNA binding protein with dsRBD fold (UPF0201 family)
MSIKLGIKETVMTGDVNGENGSKSSEKGKPKKGGETFLERAKNYIPAWQMPTLEATIKAGAVVATGLLTAKVAFSGISRVEGVSMPGASDSALAPRERSDKSTGLTPAFPEQRVLSTSSDPLPDSISPDFNKHIEAYQQRVDNPPFYYGPVQEPSDVRSRKMMPGEKKIARSAMETPSQEHREGKRAESLKLSKEEIDSLKIFADSLEKNEAALQGFKEVLNDKEAMESIENLMKNERFGKRALLELKKKGGVEQAISLLERKESVEQLISLLNGKGEVEKVSGHMSLQKSEGVNSKERKLGEQSLRKQLPEEAYQEKAASGGGSSGGGSRGGNYYYYDYGDGGSCSKKCWKITGITLGAIVGVIASCYCCCVCGESIGDSVRECGESIGNSVRECVESIGDRFQSLGRGSEIIPNKQAV